uniref:Uncharacterized protein n=1 Tax=Thermosporothrix sp. COM3 TaxID=2490863 RepID=A0A455SQ60_9CHLR|nr:hypothetical protein KTC_38230 [Thermosporothrix sp. COM3]
MRIAIWVVRVCFILALIMGVLFWTGNYTYMPRAVDTHRLLGLIVTIALWVIAGILMTSKPGNRGIAIGAFVWGIVLLIVGFTQDSFVIGPGNVVTKIVHALLGIGAIGLSEMMNARHKRD